MGHTVTRVILAILGSIGLVVGTFAVAGGGLLLATVGTENGLSTASQEVDVDGCSTVLMEIAAARVQVEQFEAFNDFDPLSDRFSSSFVVTANGTTQEPWLIGVTDQVRVEERLLGTRYCLVEVRDNAWSSVAIAPSDDAPDVVFDSVPGLWASAASGESVSLPVPGPGSTVVISGTDDSTLSSVVVTGVYAIDGASQVGLIALIGGGVTLLLGVLLLIVSLYVLRAKGRHEGTSEKPTNDSAGQLM